MRKLSLEHVYGCSTTHRHSIIGLPDNRLAFLAGSYLVLYDCSTNEQRYLSFSAVEYLYLSASSLYMGVIDRFNQDGDARIHIYSTKPVGLLFSIEPDRFGNFIAMTMNHTDNLIMILHKEPAYMITIQEIQLEEINEESRYQINDLASVRVVHGPILNRMTKKEIHPRVEYLSFSPFSSQLICVTGFALFKLYDIDDRNLHERTIHFRPEFYGFTCHCWLDPNTILIATDHGHIFWIQDGSIRSDINLQESISMDLNVSKTTDSIQMFKDDLFASSTTVNTDSSTRITEFPSEDSVVALDLLTSNEILPCFIVSFREYLLIFKPIDAEPFFHLIHRYCLRKTIEQRIDPEIHHIHKMSYIFDHQSSFIYLLTSRNQIFRYKLMQSNSTVEFEEKHLYGSHAFSILSIGLCEHKPWLITLGKDHWLRILDYEDQHREVLSKYLSEDVYAVTSSDPYGFHLCLSLTNQIDLYLITNSEFRLLHQYETRNIRAIDLSPSGHLLAVLTSNLIKIYSTITMNLISQLRGHVGKIQQISWCKSDSIVISCGSDGMIYTFNVYTGMRENEIITKQFHYLGLAVTNDCHRIYAITSDPSLKIFVDYHLETEWAIENQYLPSAICLSKSEHFLYIGMTHGIIRIYSLPLTVENYMDIPAHCSTIRRLVVSSDDQYLISIAESAYVLLFKQTTNAFSSISNQYQFSRISKEDLPREKSIENKFQYILITKTEFDEQKKRIEEIQSRINDFQTENNLKLHSKEILFAKHLNNYSNQFEQTIKDLIQTYEQLKKEFAHQQHDVHHRMNQIESEYQSMHNHLEILYENRMIETLSRIETMQKDVNQLSDQSIDSPSERMNFPEIIEQMNLVLQSKWKSSLENFDQLEQNHRQFIEYTKQMEEDTDEEIHSIKTNYENQLKAAHDYIDQLTNSVSSLRKQYNSIINRIESRDHQRREMEHEVKELENRQIDLTDELDHFRFVIKKKEARIGLHDMKIHRLQQDILHVEKRKYVLDYKTKSLLEYIEPIDQEIIKLKHNNQNLEQDLTKLKQQQNHLIAKENDYEKQIQARLREYHQMIIQHRSVWKIVKQQKGLIKQAFEYLEIRCTADLDNLHQHPRDQLKTFLENICQTLQNEPQNANEDFIHEWNQQQKWLHNQLHHLTKSTEQNRQTFSNAEREHRKAIAPFINQLRDLRQLSDEIEKKIDKHLSVLKIKSNEKMEFLDTISQILHQTDQYHHLIEEFKQLEYQIDVQDQQIQLLSSNVFRSQYSNPCSDF